MKFQTLILFLFACGESYPIMSVTPSYDASIPTIVFTIDASSNYYGAPDGGDPDVNSVPHTNMVLERSFQVIETSDGGVEETNFTDGGSSSEVDSGTVSKRECVRECRDVYHFCKKKPEKKRYRAKCRNVFKSCKKRCKGERV